MTPFFSPRENRRMEKVMATKVVNVGKVALLIALFSLLAESTSALYSRPANNTQLPPIAEEEDGGGGGASIDTYELDGYDPVEAYHQLRRHYLTSTSRMDRAHLFALSSDHYGGESVRMRHRHSHSHSQGQQQQHYSGGVNRHPHSSNSYGQTNGYEHNYEINQRCYVCLPPNKSSREAKEILSMFSMEDQGKIADCTEFSEETERAFGFDCPFGFGGCILRIHGPNISRSCSKYRLNDCKKANSVEFCYCTESLCNDYKPTPGQLLSNTEDDDEDGAQGGSGDGPRRTHQEVPLFSSEPSSGGAGANGSSDIEVEGGATTSDPVALKNIPINLNSTSSGSAAFHWKLSIFFAISFSRVWPSWIFS